MDKARIDKMKTSEERFRILFDFAPDAMYISDLKGTFIEGNKAAEKMLGYNKEELINLNDDHSKPGKRNI